MLLYAVQLPFDLHVGASGQDPVSGVAKQIAKCPHNEAKDLKL